MYYNKTAIAAGLKKRGVITQPCSERLYTLSPCRNISEGTYWRRQTSIQDIGLATRTLFVKKLINSVIGGSCLKQRYHNQTQRFRSRDGPHFDAGFLLDLWEPDAVRYLTTTKSIVRGGNFMHFNTPSFGTVEYEQKDIIRFQDGLFGFENMIDYLLIHISPMEDSFMYLQSLQDENLSFILANPFTLYPGYSPSLSKEDLIQMDLQDDTPVIFYSICVLKKPIAQSTCNLKAPLVIRTDTRKGFQVVLQDPQYGFHHPFPDLSLDERGELRC